MTQAFFRTTLLLLSMLLCLLLLSACKNDPVVAPQEEPPEKALAEIATYCPTRATYHFAGTVFDGKKCFNEGENNYQHTRQAAFVPSTRQGTLQFLLQTSPTRVNDEHVSLSSPTLQVNDYEQVNTVFSVGKKTFKPFPQQQEGFSVTYRIVTAPSSGWTPAAFDTYTSVGNQDQSSIRVIEKEELPMASGNPNRRLKVSVLVTCRLYDKDGTYKGDIKNGLLTGEIQVVR